MLKGNLGRRLLDKLVSDGILAPRGRRYYWISDHADRLLGISWNDLRLRKVNPALSQYLGDFIIHNPDLFAQPTKG